MTPFDVSTVTTLHHLRLRVTFVDGLSGEVILRESHLYGVFSALRDPQVFSQVHCTAGFVEWPGNIDLAPDAMYDAIKVNGVWVLE